MYPEQYEAKCTIEHLKEDPKTKEKTWETYDSMTISSFSLEALTERAYLYVGNPEKYKNVLAVKLTGTATIAEQEQNSFRNYADTIAIQLHVMRERTTPLTHEPKTTKQTAFATKMLAGSGAC